MIPKLVLLLASCLVAGRSVHAEILTVGERGATYGTIQSAVDASASGDTILVLPGIYTSNAAAVVDFRGKNVSIRAVVPGSSTIIDGEGQRRCVVIQSGESDQATLSGFLVRGGQAERGAGVYALGSDPNISDCQFVANGRGVDGQPLLCLEGGGVWCSGGRPAIIRCSFERNVALHGGGVFLNAEMRVFSDCSFVENGAGMGYGASWPNGSTAGGGVWIGGGTVEIMRAQFTRNKAYRGGGIFAANANLSLDGCSLKESGFDCDVAAGVLLESCVAHFVSCEFSALTTLYLQQLSGPDSQWGSGCHFNSSAVTMSHCTIRVCSANTIYGPSRGLGGGIYAVGGSAEILDCVLQSCSAGSGGAIFAQGTQLHIANCSLRENDAVYGGGAIRVLGAPTNIEGCDFVLNTVRAFSTMFDYRSDGGAVQSDGGPLRVMQCRFDRNECNGGYETSGPDSRGGGLYATGSCAVLDTTFVECRAYGVYPPTGALRGYGAAIYFQDGDLVLAGSAIRGGFGNDAIHFGSSASVRMGGCAACASLDTIISGQCQEFAPNCTVTNCTDSDSDGVPNECEGISRVDCDQNGLSDATELAIGSATDCDANGVPDSCQPDSDGDGVPDSCGCVGDVDGDRWVGGADLVALLTNWGQPGPRPEDLDRSGIVDAGDVGLLLAAWGACP